MTTRVWLWNHDATRMFEDKGGRHFWFAKKLKERGYEPVIFCANINHFRGIERPIEGSYEIAESDGIPFVFIKTTPYDGNGLGRIKNWISFWYGCRKDSKKIAKELGKPDVIIGSSVHPLAVVAAIQVARKFKIPSIGEIRDLWPEAIFTAQGVNENGIIGRILRLGEHWMYRKSKALIFTKEGDQDYLTEQGWTLEQGGDIDLKKCHYINNGIDFEDFERQINENTFEDEDLSNDKFKAIYCGTLRKVNNVENIIDAANLLKDYEDIEFLIFGDGMLREELEEKAASLGLHNIKFKGHVNKQYVPYVLSRSSVNLLNYAQGLYNWTRGNSSNKLFEYLASGKPVISSVRMGYDIIERGQCGFSLDECTPQALSDMILKIKNLPQDEYDKLSANAKETAKQFDFEVLTDRLEDVINEVLVG